MDVHSRRSFCRIACSLTAGSLAMNLGSCGQVSTTLGADYGNRLQSLLADIETGQAPALRDGANLLAETIIARKRCFVWLGDGLSQHQRWSLPAKLPPIFTPLGSTEMAATVRHGDILVTTGTGDIPVIAREHGATLIGITSPAVADDHTPDDRARLAKSVSLGGLCDHIIHTRLPVWDGLVSHPSYPFDILPGSGIVIPATVAALAGEAFHRAGSLGRIDTTAPAKAAAYLAGLRSELALFTSRQPSHKTATDLFYSVLLHSCTISVESSGNSLSETIHAHPGIPACITAASPDTHLSSDITVYCVPDNSQVSLAKAIRRISPETEGIIIGPDPAPVNIPENIIYYSIPGGNHGGLIAFDHDRRYLSVIGVLNEAAFWMLIGDAAGQLLAEGIIPPFLMGNHLAGSTEQNRAARAAFNQNARQ